MYSFDAISSLFVTLLVVIDPPALAPILLGLTPDMSNAQRKQTAFFACSIAFYILIISALLGSKILMILGISFPAFRIAGGLLLFWIAFEMVFSKRTERRQETAVTAITKDHIKNIAAFPLAVPLIAGPGAISTSILMAEQSSGIIGGIIIIFLIFIVVAASYTCMLLAGSIHKVLGETGGILLSRLLGVLLVALSIQLIGDGIQEFILLKSNNI
ncbi:MarC family protein [Bartonella sp. DGB1]|uniref:MarC family protein n=1 Tax=Bartonella sp. DGB1 TaxID=3239807 RepID=UPI00352680F4